MSISFIKPADVARDTKNHLIIDVRTPEEHATGHIQSSVLLPLPKLTPEAVRGMLHSGQSCVLVCHAGTRAAKAVALLSEAGIENLAVINLIKKNFLSDIPLIILGDVFGLEKVDMLGFINKHQVCTMIKWLEKCIISLLDKISSVQ